MTRSTGNRRLREAMADAARRLETARQRVAARTGPAAPGDVYALNGLGQDDLGWLVVRPHPEQAGQVLLVPLDDHPLCGTPDVPLPEDQVARCGEGVWVSHGLLPADRRVDVVADEALQQVRAGVAALALGQLVSDPERRVAEDDPDYAR